MSSLQDRDSARARIEGSGLEILGEVASAALVDTGRAWRLVAGLEATVRVPIRSGGEGLGHRVDANLTSEATPHPGEAEFVTLVEDGSVLCGVTAEEYATARCIGQIHQLPTSFNDEQARCWTGDAEPVYGTPIRFVRTRPSHWAPNTACQVAEGAPRGRARMSIPPWVPRASRATAPHRCCTLGDGARPGP